MIHNALILLREELTAYLISQGDPATVVIENIGLFETEQGADLQDNIIISLVNIEEESSLKNGQTSTKWPDGKARYENRPVYLNLYVLVTANFPGGVPPNNGYVHALKRLSLNSSRERTFLRLLPLPSHCLPNSVTSVIRTLLRLNLKLKCTRSHSNRSIIYGDHSAEGRYHL